MGSQPASPRWQPALPGSPGTLGALRRASGASEATLGTTKEVLGFIIDFLAFKDFLGFPIHLLGFSYSRILT